jgi:hypothetical protein
VWDWSSRQTSRIYQLHCKIFGGRRWNLTVTNTLRHTAFEPVRSVFVSVDAEGAGIYGSQSCQNFDRDDVEHVPAEIT